MKKSAIISDCGTYRYELRRVWDESLPAVLFIGINPSTADHINDDPTVRVCINYAMRWGYGSLVMGNLFAYRSMDRDKLKDDAIGPDNNLHLRQLIDEAALVLCAWGDHSAIGNRDREVLAMIPEPMCLTILKNGRPGHPLMKSRNLKPIPLQSNGEAAMSAQAYN